MATRRVGRRVLELSNEDKVLFPRDGITKGDLVDYYVRVAEHLLPHLAGRPLVLQRFPDGIGKDGFYQKQVGEHFPDWIDTVRVAVRTTGARQELVVCETAAALGYLANLACVTVHPWLSRRDRLERPDLLVFDLDPPGDDFEQVRAAARRLRALLEDLDVASFPKLTGSRGLHVVVPLDRGEPFDAVRDFGASVATLLAARHPDALTTEQRKQKRRGRLYLDVGRNAWAQTAVAPYAVRALPGAPVAAPLDWEELGRRGPRDYTMRNVFRRLGQIGDPWQGMRRRARSLARARERLERLRERGQG